MCCISEAVACLSTCIRACRSLVCNSRIAAAGTVQFCSRWISRTWLTVIHGVFAFSVLLAVSAAWELGCVDDVMLKLTEEWPHWSVLYIRTLPVLHCSRHVCHGTEGPQKSSPCTAVHIALLSYVAPAKLVARHGLIMAAATALLLLSMPHTLGAAVVPIGSQCCTLFVCIFQTGGQVLWAD